MGAPLVCFLLCTKLLSQQMHGDIKIHFFALITKTTMIFTKTFIARRSLNAMCPNSNLISKICENAENLAHFACEKCLYNSIFALPIDHAKKSKRQFSSIFTKKKMEALRSLENKESEAKRDFDISTSGNAYIIAFAEQKTSKIEKKREKTSRNFTSLRFTNAYIVMFATSKFRFFRSKNAIFSGENAHLTFRICLHSSI